MLMMRSELGNVKFNFNAKLDYPNFRNDLVMAILKF